MNYETMDQILLNALSEDKIKGPNTAEEKLIKKIKQGKHCLISVEKLNDLDLVLFWSTIIKAPQAFEGAPRVLWITQSNERAKRLISTLQVWVRRSEIAIESANESGKKIEQRNNIFEGADVIIGTPKRTLELYNQNGFHINQLTLVIMDEINGICTHPTELQHLRRICESIDKCQKLFISYGKHERLIPFVEEICYSYEEIEFQQENE